MDNNNLFRLAASGYESAQVDEYIKLLRSEYKKVYDYAKAVEANNEKLKKICKTLSEENTALKTSASPVAAVAADNSELLAGIDKLAALCDEIKRENDLLRAKIANS